MKIYFLHCIIFTAAGLLLSAQSCSKKNIELTVDEAAKKVDVKIDGKLFTSYMYPDNIMKPVLWPLMSSRGNMLTRSFPMAEKAGDRVDHPHHVGVWLNYGDVNGLDFWNNSEAIPEDRKHKYGTIYHKAIERVQNGMGSASLGTKATWKTPGNEVLLEEQTTFDFLALENVNIIDRTTTLTAIADEVSFTDNKEGMFAVRVARELELPSDKPTKLMDSHGVVTEVKQMDNSLVRGNYRSSEGIEGEGVWGTRGRWMKLSSVIKGEEVSLVIIDHPDNVGYPTYWHARGYGLFSANTLGQKALSDGRDELNFRMKKGDTTTFRYRLVVASQDLSDQQINKLTDQFAKSN